MSRWNIHPLPQNTLGEFTQAWDALNDHLWDGHPLLASHFVEGLLRSFGTGGETLCTASGDDGQAVAMLILVRIGAGRWSSFLPSQAPISPVLMQDGADLHSLICALPGRAQMIDFLSIDSRFCRLPTSPSSEVDLSWHGLTMDIDLSGGFEAYWQARPAKLRMAMRRYERKLLELGQAEHRVLQTAGEIGSAVERYGRIEQAGWKGRAGTAVTPASGQQGFYLATLQLFAAGAGAQIHELWVGDHLIASRLVIRRGGLLVTLKTTYDEAFAACAPGRLLLVRLITWAFEAHPGERIEFYTNANHDQLQWSTGSQPIHHLTLFRSAAVKAGWPLLGAGRQLMAGRRPAVLTPDMDNELLTTQVSTPQELPPDARALMDVTGPKSLQCGPDWYASLCGQGLAGGEKAQFHLLSQGGNIIAVLPVIVGARRRFTGRQIEALANYYTAIYAPALAPGVEINELAYLVAAVLAQHHPVSRLRFAPMEPAGRETTLLRRALERCGLATFPYFCFGNWYLPAKGLDWPGYLALRSSKERSNIQRPSRKFAAEGGVLEIITSGDRLLAAIDAYWRVYGNSWKQDEPRPAFVTDLIHTAAERGWLRLGVAWLKDEPIAAQLWFVSQGRAEIYKVAYDEAFTRLSIGTVLTAHMMEGLLSEGSVAEVDYLMGDDSYKSAWMSQRRERWGYVAYNLRTVTGLAGALRETAWRILKPSLRRAAALSRTGKANSAPQIATGKTP